MMLDMHLLRETPHLCKTYRISHHISVTNATSPAFASPDEIFPFTFNVKMIFAALNKSKAAVQVCNC
jgi:hypothetical protein